MAAQAPPRTNLVAVTLAALAPVFHGCGTVEDSLGPMPIRNQHPAQLNVLSMDPRPAEVLPADRYQLRLDFAYSSLFVEQLRNNREWFMDGEIFRNGLKARYGLGHGLEVFGEFAWAITGPGFLDDFVEDWHDFFDLPNQGRENFPQDRWQVDATDNGNTLWEMDRTDGALLDLPLGLAWNLLPRTEDQPFAVTLRGAVEIPIGNEDRGFGNGGFEVAVGAVADYQHGPFAVNVHAQYAFAETPDDADDAGLDFEDVTSAGLGLELAIAEHTSVHAQLLFETSTLRDLDLDVTEDPQWTIWFGVRHRIGNRFAAEVGFGEDLDADAPPDFTAYLAFVFDLGPRRH